MATNTIYREAPHKENPPKKISIQAFLRKYRKGGLSYKYEFNNGAIENTGAMRFGEHHAVLNLQEALRQAASFEQSEICSGDMRCGAEPVVPGFFMTASDIFKKP